MFVKNFKLLIVCIISFTSLQSADSDCRSEESKARAAYTIQAINDALEKFECILPEIDINHFLNWLSQNYHQIFNHKDKVETGLSESMARLKINPLKNINEKQIEFAIDYYRKAYPELLQEYWVEKGEIVYVKYFEENLT
ncbi:MAG: hypothetical protein P4L22_04370 [Candidatus Babeliales bacterium]|nr:hypothetical protein [Candidatus Babeliales bacterium]